jgi:hypothetical protein
MPETVKSNVMLFADDTKMYREIRSINDTDIFQNDLDMLSDWSDKWLLQFHPNKCSIMKFGKGHNNSGSYTLKANNKTITLSTSNQEKDIGVTFDTELNFEEHIHLKINTACKMSNIIRRSYRFLDIKTFIPLYKAMVRSHFDYASSIWYPLKKRLIDQIESVQRRATKMLPNLRNLSYPERLSKLNLPTLAYRRARGDMIELYKICNNIYDSDVTKNLLTFNTDLETRTSSRGHKFKLVQDRLKTRIRKQYFTKRVVKVWNNMPVHVVNAPSINSFKSRLDKCWQNQPIKYIYTAEVETSLHREYRIPTKRASHRGSNGPAR